MPENSSCIPAAFTSAIFGACRDGKDIYHMSLFPDPYSPVVLLLELAAMPALGII